MIEPRTLRPHADAAVELVAINRALGLDLFDPSPQDDSAAETLAALKRHRDLAPREIDRLIDATFHHLRRALSRVALEGHGERALAGSLDELATPQQAIAAQLNVKGLARALREPLATLREHPGDIAATRAVRRIVRTVGPGRLAGSLRGELGKGPHDQLMRLVGEGR